MGRAEGKIEDYVDQRVRELGGETRKVVYQGRRGSPDRWCFFKGGQLCMIECKTARGRTSAAQEDAIKFLSGFGFQVFVCQSRADVDQALSYFLGFGESVSDLV